MTYLNNEQVLALATRLHEGQVRRDGKPYITHSIAVAELVLEVYKDYRGNIYYPSESKYVLIQTAYLHDVLEDCFFIDEKYLLDQGVDPVVVRYCKDLNKENFPSYFKMLENLVEMPDFRFAIICKNDFL